MLLLALDTSTSAITVALHDGSQVLAEATTLDPRAHAEHLAPGIRAVLRQAGAVAEDVDEVVAGRGPGPFTGLRVGLVTARAFAAVRGIPVSGVCSLDVLAFQALATRAAENGGPARPLASPGTFTVATDARRREVYWAVYTAGGPLGPDAAGGPLGPDAAGGPFGQDARTPDLPRRLTGPHVGRAAEIVGATARPVVGRGGLLYPDAFGPAFGPLDVSAGAVAALVVRRRAVAGAGAPPGVAAPREEPADPMYLRRPDAQPTAAATQGRS